MILKKVSASFFYSNLISNSTDVALYDYLKEEVGFRLADRVFDIKREFKNAADIGCNRGYISKHILAECVEHLTLTDTSASMLEQAQGTPGLRMSKLVQDEEQLDVGKQMKLMHKASVLIIFYPCSLKRTPWT